MAIASLILVLPIGSFLTSEARHFIALKSYSPSATLVEVLATESRGVLSDLATGNEHLVCVLNAYGREDDLGQLNSQQRASVSAISLPSEDGTWFLLFFSEHRVERVMAVRQTHFRQGTFAIDGCGSLKSIFVNERYVSPNGETEFRFQIFKE